MQCIMKLSGVIELKVTEVRSYVSGMSRPEDSCWSKSDSRIRTAEDWELLLFQLL